MDEIKLAKEILESKGYTVTKKVDEEKVYLKDIIDTWNMLEKYGIKDYEADHDIAISKRDYEKMLNGTRNKSYIKNLRVHKKTNESADSEYAMWQKMFKHKKEFSNKEKQSGEIRDYTDDLDAHGIEYEIYFNRTNKGITIFHESVSLSDSFDNIAVGDVVKWDTKDMKEIPEIGEMFRIGPVTGECTAVEDGKVTMKVKGHSWR